MELSRSAGILLHPTSLPSGKLDREAYRFVDWLAAAGQSWWQVLPLGPPDEFGSPYRVAVGVRGLARSSSPSRTRGSRPARSRTSSRAIRTGPATGRASPAREALADQVRFEREWGALRALRAPSAASA